MPSVSKEQAHTMSAIAHGWEPKGTAKDIPLKVANDFHAADKKVGKWEHQAKKKGGHVKCSAKYNY